VRVAINLLTDDPANPSGAHWFWTRVIPEMAKSLTADEEFHLLVSERCRPLHEGYGPNVDYLMFPWSNENPPLRTLSEHLLTPLRLPKAKIDVFNTGMAPLFRVAPSLVIHFKTLHAYTAPASVRLSARAYRRLSYPRTARLADAIIINSESLRAEVERYLDVDPARLHLIPEAVDHELFRPGDREEALAHIGAKYGVREAFILFVSSLWPYKNCAGLLRAYSAARSQLDGRRLVIVGPARDVEHADELRALAAELGIADGVDWVGGVPLEETVRFYRAADTFVYPSLNETFGLPILEAMATACPVVTSSVSAMPETAGGAALLADPTDQEALAVAIVQACGPENARLRAAGPVRAAEFSWAATAEKTLEVYRAVYRRQQENGRSR
jgi:glycosyltransferase involved in cell wall biosynthesis